MQTNGETRHESMTMEAVIHSLPRIATALEKIVELLSEKKEKKDDKK